MFERFERSWELTRLSFRLIATDKELLLFPIAAAVFSGMFLLLMLLPLVIGGSLSRDIGSHSMVWAVLVILYFGLSLGFDESLPRSAFTRKG